MSGVTPADDRGSNAPGTVRVKPGGWYVAVRVAEPAAWLVVYVRTGKTQLVRIADIRAAQIYEDWVVV